MKTENRTPFPVYVQREYEGDTLAIVDVTTKVTIDVGTNGGLAIARDQLPVHVDPALEAPMGEVRYARSDKIVEVVVVGAVGGENDAVFAKKTLVLRVGEHERRLTVWGPRRWVRHAENLRPSEPEPVMSVNMEWGLAYGGTKRMPPGFFPDTHLPAPSTELAWALNPIGTGFYRDAGDAEGSLLPQIEDPSHEVETWDTHPRPACWAAMPANCGRRMEHFGVKEERLVNKDSSETPLLERMVLNASPDLQFIDVEVGTAIFLSGFQGADPFTMKLPHPPFHWMIRTGNREPSVFAPILTAITLRPNDRRVSMVYRTRASAPLIRGEEREAIQLFGATAAQ